MPILPLDCPVQHYAWGSTTKIPMLTKRENPAQEAWAELWMGAHPKACSTLPGGQPLSEFIRAAPKAALGPSADAFDNTLPFLFKILAAAQPLSIQCHPNLLQARAGFAAENAAGLALDAPERNYRDANHKPELIVALEDFWALKGFRHPKEIRTLAGAVGLKSLAPLLASLAEDQGLATFFRGLWTMDETQKEITLHQLASGLSGLPANEARWTQEFLDRYPGDIAATAAIVLQLVKLEAGEALYLGAGELHAYLQGTGLEIMANSDNVLRGGLTPKHVDVEELMRVLRFEHSPLQVLRATPMSPSAQSGLATYTTPSREFALYRLVLKESEDFVHALSSATIFLSLGGQTQLQWGDEHLKLDEGGVAFATADTSNVRLRGNADLWIATIGTRSSRVVRQSDEPVSPVPLAP